MAQLSLVSLFSGAGGLDYGLEQAGWHCRYASDIDPLAVETLCINRDRQAHQTRFLANAFIEGADVRRSRGSEIAAKAGLRKGEITLLSGGPPCQSWSSAGHQKGFEDPRGQLFSDFVRLAGELDARWLMFENVRGLLTARDASGVPGSALHAIRSRLLLAGYQTQVHLVNAADYGIPQRRVRLLVVGYRRGDPPLFPPPSHQKNGDILERREWTSMRACLRELAPLSEDEIIRPSGRLASELSGLPPGTGAKSHGKVESTRPGGHWGYKQGAFVANMDLPARTITASAQQDWIRDPKLGLRRLSPRECAALQTFPSDWIFAGNRAAQYRLIGNAVPPKLAELAGQALRSHILSEKNPAKVAQSELLPLFPQLAAAIRYTTREEARNGKSRRTAPSKRAGCLSFAGLTAN